jgi:hypothetical protein
LSLLKAIKILVLIIAFMGAIQLVIGILKMTPDILGRLSRSYISFSTRMLDNLSAQKADVIIGLLLVSFAFVIQLMTEIFDNNSFILPFAHRDSVLLIILICLILLLVIRAFHRILRKQIRINAGKALIVAQAKEEWFNHVPVRNLRIDRIERSAKILCFFERSDNEDAIEFLRRLGRYIKFDLINFIKARYNIDEELISQHLK